MKPQEQLRMQADAMDMVEGTRLEWQSCVQVKKSSGGWVVKKEPSMSVDFEYRLALCILEGKPVFAGDEIWNVKEEFKFTVHSWDRICKEVRLISEKNSWAWLKNASWNPPKPKTVMVELPLEVAKNLVEFDNSPYFAAFNPQLKIYIDACKKALKELK